MKRALVVVVGIAACSSKKPREADPTPPPPPPAIDAAPPADADPALVAVTTPVPPGPYVVTYECSHDNMPFGKGSWYRHQSIDLGAMTWTTLEVTLTGDEDKVPPDRRPPPPKSTVTEASAAVADTIRAGVARVLAGGPYRPEIPVSEGVPCVLRISAAGAVVLKIDKADTKEKDAVSELIGVLTTSVGR